LTQFDHFQPGKHKGILDIIFLAHNISDFKTPSMTIFFVVENYSGDSESVDALIEVLSRVEARVLEEN